MLEDSRVSATLLAHYICKLRLISVLVLVMGSCLDVVQVPARVLRLFLADEYADDLFLALYAFSWNTYQVNSGEYYLTT